MTTAAAKVVNAAASIEGPMCVRAKLDLLERLGVLEDMRVMILHWVEQEMVDHRQKLTCNDDSLHRYTLCMRAQSG